MKNIVVYLDMDGVLVDWLNGMREFAGEPPSFYDEFRRDPSSLNEDRIMEKFGGEANTRKIMFDRPSDFWLNLPLFPWANTLIDKLKRSFDELCFFSSPGNNPEAAKAKLQWHLDRYPEIPMFLGKHKHLAASENKVLIDDTPKKIKMFTQAGGYGILWPNQFIMERMTTNAEILEVIDRTIARIKSYDLTRLPQE